MSYCWFAFRKQYQRLLVSTNTSIILGKKKKVNILCNTVRKEKKNLEI